jgi:curved DNA-binding protein CbpA
MKEPRDAYKVLQVDPEADLDVIKAAYRRLAQKYHPDRVSPGAEVDVAALRMVEINAAWDQLREPGRRSDYDRRRALDQAAAEARREPATPGRPPSSASPASTSAGGGSGSGSEAFTSPPPGRPSGSVLNFGRYTGWSLGEIGRQDPAYLEWLDRMPIGRPFRQELDVMLRRLGRRTSGETEINDRRGLYRRR